MAARLILNADDFGFTRGINRAVAELHDAGVLTSATLMANGPAFEEAVAIARARPSLGVGCHVVLVGGSPVSPSAAVRTLLDGNGVHFRNSLPDFIFALWRGRIDPAEIEREALAQVQKLQDAGIPVTHLDTHKHTHIWPPVAGALARIAQRTGVGLMRNPFEPPFARKASHAALLRRLQVAALDTFQTGFNAIAAPHLGTDGTLGISATGSLNAETLRQIVAHLPERGTLELLCHPGYHNAELDRVGTVLREHREIERKALLEELPRRLAQPNAPQLIHYGDLYAERISQTAGSFRATSVRKGQLNHS